jgi:hypothetical protein
MLRGTETIWVQGQQTSDGAKKPDDIGNATTPMKSLMGTSWAQGGFNPACLIQ